MEERNLDVLLITDPANLYYLSEYDAYSFYVPQILTVTLEQDQPVGVWREQDYRCATETTWLDEENILLYTDAYVDAERHPMQFVVDILWERNIVGTVGVEMDTYYFSARAYTALRRALPEGSMKDATGLVNWCRTVKSDREVEYHQYAAQISEHAMAVGVETIEPGVRQCGAAAVYDALLSGTESAGGEYPAIVR